MKKKLSRMGKGQNQNDPMQTEAMKKMLAIAGKLKHGTPDAFDSKINLNLIRNG